MTTSSVRFHFRHKVGCKARYLSPDAPSFAGNNRNLPFRQILVPNLFSHGASILCRCYFDRKTLISVFTMHVDSLLLKIFSSLRGSLPLAKQPHQATHSVPSH